MARAASSTTRGGQATVLPAPSGTRAPWGSMSRELVVTAATALVAAGGYQQLTIRGLAAELGVAPMSIYRHVRDKDDLLDEVVDRLLATAWQPDVGDGDWQKWIADATDKLRRFLVTQPAALHVYLRHPVVSPAAVERMEAILQVLRNVTTDEDEARRAYAAIHTYTIGFAALEATRADWRPTESSPDQLADRLAAYTTPQQFAQGLEYLLDGIAGHRPPDPSPAGRKRRSR